MINYEKTKIRQYEKFLRELINSVVQKIDFEKLNRNKISFLSKTKERFHFDDVRGWKFLMSCLDTIGDSQFAVTTFVNHKIKNGKDFNIGEQYLRIYGVLSAIYIQQQAIKKLFDLFKIEETASLINEINDLDITFLRHCISAHPINFDNSNDKVSSRIDRNSITDLDDLYIINEQNNLKYYKILSFRIDRNSVTNLGDLCIVNEQNDIENYNIFKSIEQYEGKAEFYIESVITKMIKNIYKTAVVKKKELEEKFNQIKYDN